MEFLLTIQPHSVIQSLICGIMSGTGRCSDLLDIFHMPQIRSPSLLKELTLWAFLSIQPLMKIDQWWAWAEDQGVEINVFFTASLLNRVLRRLSISLSLRRVPDRVVFSIELPFFYSGHVFLSFTWSVLGVMTLLTDGFQNIFQSRVLVNNPLSLSDCFLLDMVLNAMEQKT